MLALCDLVVFHSSHSKKHISVFGTSTSSSVLYVFAPSFPKGSELGYIAKKLNSHVTHGHLVYTTTSHLQWSLKNSHC